MGGGGGGLMGMKGVDFSSTYNWERAKREGIEERGVVEGRGGGCHLGVRLLGKEGEEKGRGVVFCGDETEGQLMEVSLILDYFVHFCSLVC